LGKVWYDLDHVWYLEPKTLAPCPMNFTIDSENPSFRRSLKESYIQDIR
jgi:hypothetical protein